MLVDSKELVANLQHIADSADLSTWAKRVLGIAAACVEQAEEDQKNNDKFCEVLRDIVSTCSYAVEGIENKEDYGRITLVRIHDKALKVLGGMEAGNAKTEA